MYFSVFSIYAVTNPYLPVLLRGLGYSPSAVGVLMGIFEGAGILGPFIFSYFTDRWGRYKPSITITYILIIISAYPLIAFNHFLFSAVFISLLSIGLKTAPSLLDAVITIQLGQTGGDYGKVRAAGSLGFIVFALLLQWTRYRQPGTPENIAFWIGVTAVFGMVAMLILLKEIKGEGLPQAAAFDSSRTIPVGKTWNPVFLLGIVMIAFGRFALSPAVTFLSLFVLEELKSETVGLIWAVSTMAEMPMMFFSNKIMKRFSAFSLLAVSSLAVGIRLGCYVLFPSLSGVIAGQLLHSLCFGIFHPAAVRFVTDYVPPERRAMGMSIYISLGTGLPTFLGNTLGGFVLEQFGYRVLFISYIPFAVISLILYFLLRPYVNKPVLR